MSDYLLSATAGNGSVRAYIARTTEMVKEAEKIHNTSLTATVALGRMLTGASIMGYMYVEGEQLITLSLKGNGPLQGIIATADGFGNTKGYVFKPNEEISLKSDGSIDVATGVGFGTLTILRDTGAAEPYVGQVDLMSGEIAEDLAFYFTQSEQIPSAVSLGVYVNKDSKVQEAGGYIIQMLPGADDSIAQKLDEKLKSMEPVSSLLAKGKTLEEILAIIFEGMDFKINDEKPVQYHCNCSRERVEKALITLGVDEIKEIMETDKKATLHCHFCQKDYEFSEAQLFEILSAIA